LRGDKRRHHREPGQRERGGSDSVETHDIIPFADGNCGLDSPPARRLPPNWGARHVKILGMPPFTGRSHHLLKASI
jgi:hypothetical protein